MKKVIQSKKRKVALARNQSTLSKTTTHMKDRLISEQVFTSPVGRLLLRASPKGLSEIRFMSSKDKASSGQSPEAARHLQAAAQQLKEFFSGTRREFDLDLDPSGTPFQKKVWKALSQIPYGKTWSYQDVAKKVGCPKGPRAVGMANNRNPIAIVVPCHRVIGKNGALVGYGGGLPIKEQLLRLEGN